MKKSFLFAMIAFSFAMVACQKNEPSADGSGDDKETPEEQTSEQSVSFITPSVAFSGNFVEASGAMMNVKTKALAPLRLKAESETYPKYSWTPEDGKWPIVLTADFGATGVLGYDGLTHTGTLTLNATGMFEDSATVITLNLDKYYCMGNALAGTQKIENIGANAAGNLVFDVTVNNANFGKEGVTYNENTARELIAGLVNGKMDSTLTNHVYSITGTMEVKYANGDSTCTLTSKENPMQMRVGDLYPTSGAVTVAFDPAIEIDMTTIYDSLKVAPALRKNPKFDSMEVTFLGKNSAGKYDAQTSITIDLTVYKQDMLVSFILDENGIDPNSIKYKNK